MEEQRDSSWGGYAGRNGHGRNVLVRVPRNTITETCTQNDSHASNDLCINDMGMHGLVGMELEGRTTAWIIGAGVIF